MMRIAIFTDTFTPQINGVTNTLKMLIEYLEDNSIEYRLFAPKYDDDINQEKTERFYSLKLFLYPECRMAIPNVFRITQALNDFHPDIVHLMTEFNMGIIGLRYAKKNHIPCLSNYTTNYSQYMDYYKLKVLKPVIWNYMRWFHDQADLTVCPSRETEKLLNNNGINRTGLFSRGIDSSKFNPAHRSDALRNELGIQGKTTFLYVGRISVEKDLDILAEAYSMLKCKHGDHIALVITGDGPYMENCKEILPCDTIYTGFQSGINLAKIYASCDIFILPSTSETFGNVILEAMASGIAVIGADAGGIKEIIDHDVNGLKFKGRDTKHLADCMDLLLNNMPLRHKLAYYGVQFSGNRSWSSIFKGLYKLYQGLTEAA